MILSDRSLSLAGWLAGCLCSFLVSFKFQSNCFHIWIPNRTVLMTIKFTKKNISNCLLHQPDVEFEHRVFLSLLRRKTHSHHSYTDSGRQFTHYLFKLLWILSILCQPYCLRACARVNFNSFYQFTVYSLLKLPLSKYFTPNIRKHIKSIEVLRKIKYSLNGR